MKMNIYASIWLTGLVLAAAPRVLADALSVAGQIKAEPVFASPLDWTGDQPPAEAESAALLQAINGLRTTGSGSGFAALEDFLTAYPQSAWAPALHVSLAEYYRSRGRYSLALSHWEAAWDETKAGHDRRTQKLAARDIAGWTRLLASLGEKEKTGGLVQGGQ